MLSHPVMVNQLAGYRYIRVAATNGDKRDKPFSLYLKTTDGKVYTAAAVNAGKTSPAHVMEAGAGFTYYVFDLARLTDEDGKAVAAAEDVLKRVGDMQFTVEDSTDGAVYLDDVQFSTGLFAEETIPEPDDVPEEEKPVPSTGLLLSVGTVMVGILLVLSAFLAVKLYKKRMV